jgi:hypothetical protein
MDAITREALRSGDGTRTWRVEFDCDGTPFACEARAKNEGDARVLAAQKLAAREPLFAPGRARVSACIEKV